MKIASILLIAPPFELAEGSTPPPVVTGALVGRRSPIGGGSGGRRSIVGGDGAAAMVRGASGGRSSVTGGT